MLVSSPVPLASDRRGLIYGIIGPEDQACSSLYVARGPARGTRSGTKGTFGGRGTGGDQQAIVVRIRRRGRGEAGKNILGKDGDGVGPSYILGKEDGGLIGGLFCGGQTDTGKVPGERERAVFHWI